MKIQPETSKLITATLFVALMTSAITTVVLAQGANYPGNAGSCWYFANPNATPPTTAGVSGSTLDNTTTCTSMSNQCTTDAINTCLSYATPPSGTYKMWTYITTYGDSCVQPASGPGFGCRTCPTLDGAAGYLICAQGDKYNSQADCDANNVNNSQSMVGYASGGCM